MITTEVKIKSLFMLLMLEHDVSMTQLTSLVKRSKSLANSGEWQELYKNNPELAKQANEISFKF